MDTTTYELLRDKMQTGDAMIFAGEGVVSKIIQWRTKSPYSHVAMIARWKPHLVERVFLFQATAQFGVHPVPVSRYLAQYRGAAWWVPLTPEIRQRVPDCQPRLLDAAAMDFGRAYDVSGIGQFLLSRVFKQSEANRFCSEAYASWLNAVGVSQETFVDPGQLIRQPVFQQPRSLV